MNINQQLEKAGLTARICFVVRLVNVSDQFRLRRYGDIVYFSKKMKYCILYVNKSDANRIEKEIAALHFVKSIERSEKAELNLDSNHIEHQLSQMAQDAEAKLEKRKSEDLHQ